MREERSGKRDEGGGPKARRGKRRGVLVTGASGFIGSHLVGVLLERGWRVVGLDAFTSDYEATFKWNAIEESLQHDCFRLVKGDVRDAELLRSIFAEEHISDVYHLAGKVGVRESLDAEAEYYQVNVHGTETLLQEIVFAGVNRILFTSSSSVYGRSLSLPIKENALLAAINPYGESKLKAELLCNTFGQKHGIDARVVRLFTAYGPGARPDMGISTFVQRMEEGIPLTILGDGKAQRDFTYIADIVQGILCVGMASKAPHAVNVGSGRTISINGLIEILSQATGITPLIEYVEAHPFDVATTHAEITAAASFGYRPKVMISEGISRYVSWVRRQMKESTPGMAA